MAEFKTSHRGFDIIYSENRDVWYCSTLDVEHLSLVTLKRKIEAIERKSRAVESFPAFHAQYGDQIVPVTVTAKVLKGGSGSRYWDSKDGVWCVQKDGTRKKVEMSALIEDTPENRELIANYERLRDEARAADVRKKDALKAIPRMTADQIPAADPEIETEG